MTEESVKFLLDNAAASKYDFISLSYVWQRKLIQYKDIRHKVKDPQRSQKRPWKTKSCNSCHNNFSASTSSLLQDLAPIL